MTAVHGTLRPVRGEVAICVAGGGHPVPLLRRVDGRVEPVPVAGPIIGMLPDVTFEPVELALAPGETLVCFTDGLTDASGGTGLFGMDGVAEVLADCDGMVAQAIAGRVLQEVLEFLDGRPHDDIAVLTLQAEPACTDR